MGKIIIDNRSSLSDSQVLDCVAQVIQKGRISNYGKQYCYLSTFSVSDAPDLVIATDLNEKSDRFIAYDDKR